MLNKKNIALVALVVLLERGYYFVQNRNKAAERERVDNLLAGPYMKLTVQEEISNNMAWVILPMVCGLVPVHPAPCTEVQFENSNQPDFMTGKKTNTQEVAFSHYCAGPSFFVTRPERAFGYELLSRVRTAGGMFVQPAPEDVKQLQTWQAGNCSAALKVV